MASKTIAAKAPPIPTKEQLIEWLAKLKAFYRTRNTAMSLIEDLYFDISYTEDKATKSLALKLPVARNMLNKALDLLVGQEIINRVPPRNDEEGAIENSTLLENYLNGAWYRMEMEQQKQLRRDFAFFNLFRGWYAFKLVFDAEGAGNGEFGPYGQVLDPMFVYPKEGPRGWQEIFYEYETDLGSIRAEFPEVGKLRDKTEDKNVTVKVIEYWSKWHKALLVDGEEVIKPQVHSYGMPAIICGSSFGTPVRSTENKKTNYADRIGLSFLSSTEPLANYKNDLVSQIATIVAYYANPTTTLEGEMSSGEFDRTRGAHNEIVAGSKVSFLQWQGSPPDIYKLNDFIDQELQKGGFPAAMWGDWGDVSGFSGNSLTQNARSILQPYIESIQFGLSNVNSLLLRLAEEFEPAYKDAFSVYYPGVKTLKSGATSVGRPETRRNGKKKLSYERIVITDKDIDGYYRNEVELVLNVPQNEAQLINTAGMAKDKKLWDWVTAIEYTGQEGPDVVKRDILADEIYEDPAMKAYLVGEALMQRKAAAYQEFTKAHPELNIGFADFTKVQGQAHQQIGSPPPAGGPPIPQGPPPPPNMALPPSEQAGNPFIAPPTSVLPPQMAQGVNATPVPPDGLGQGPTPEQIQEILARQGKLPPMGLA